MPGSLRDKTLHYLATGNPLTLLHGGLPAQWYVENDAGPIDNHFCGNTIRLCLVELGSIA
ncbi:hypothetical protein CBW56_10140 [Denitratisoma oestradiolicum]|nr:hypothetical protein CBW56_10140 [Denitratisoma oestradiolicum]